MAESTAKQPARQGRIFPERKVKAIAFIFL
ncbi:hypothetical protein NIES4072_50420 [Nostoc commune NIES-4072]|uniref:Uncharacterized protein n=1 Tax=Nostoc commune NIES-4072 TaxID=2005467 RepID=A0A2R5FV73_NOSCO|nr:hypothetical protein NIES4070_40530 [Nostoc commune HK-02]GBG21358.1 hypothetical protein NIES4072_50420 [Nostoc commune NIES-4072]